MVVELLDRKVYLRLVYYLGMVYHFFEKWKDVELETGSIHKELLLIEEDYKHRVILFEKIISSISSRSSELDLKLCKQLRDSYRTKKSTVLLELVLRKLQRIAATEILNKSEVDNFIQIIYTLSELHKRESELSLDLLSRLVEGNPVEPIKIYELKELLNSQSIFYKHEDEQFKKIEETFLIRKNPGPRVNTYLNLITAVQRGIVQAHLGTIWFNGIPIQGVRIIDNMVHIRGDHYTSMENGRTILRQSMIQSSLADPYSYILEKGKISSRSINEIKKLIGAAHAETVISLEVEVFPEQVFIWVRTGLPTKFAIAHLQEHQVTRILTKKLQKIA